MTSNKLLAWVVATTAVLTAAASTASADPATCWQLSSSGQQWSRTPEELCLEPVAGAPAAEGRYTMLFKFGLDGKTLATFNVKLQSRVKCADCNQDVFALGDAANSVFAQFAVRFKGTRTLATGAESGTVTIGKHTLHYRKLAPAKPGTSLPAPAPAPADPAAKPMPPKPTAPPDPAAKPMPPKPTAPPAH